MSVSKYKKLVYIESFAKMNGDLAQWKYLRFESGHLKYGEFNIRNQIKFHI